MVPKLTQIAQDIRSFVAGKDLVVFAIGIALSNALQSTLNTVINNLIMPFVSYFSGVTDLADRSWMLHDGPPAIKLGWGAALNALITFVITLVIMVEFVKYVTTNYVRSSTIQWS